MDSPISKLVVSLDKPQQERCVLELQASSVDPKLT